MVDITTWWSDDRRYRLTFHKCAHCGQQKVVGIQSHTRTPSPPEGIRHQYGNWDWVVGGRGGLGLLLCDSCLHFEGRIIQKRQLQKTIDESIQKMKEIHEATKVHSLSKGEG